MRTGAAGVIVGVGADSFSHQRRRARASGCRWPARSPTPRPPAATTSTRPAAGTCTSSPTAGSRPAAPSPGHWPAVRTPSSSASRCASAAEAPGGGIWWDSVAAHPRLPRGGTSAPVAPARARWSRCCSARPRPSDGRTNLFGALRRTMAKTGYRDLKEFQRVDLVIGGYPTGGSRRTDGLPDRPRRRLRRPVRAADRPADPRGGRLLRDRSARRSRSTRCSPASPRRSCCPAARPASTRRAPRRSTRRSFEAGVPAFGICYGFQAMAQSLGGAVAHTGDREYGGTPLTVTTGGPAVRRAAGRSSRSG